MHQLVEIDLADDEERAVYRYRTTPPPKGGSTRKLGVSSMRADPSILLRRSSEGVANNAGVQAPAASGAQGSHERHEASKSIALPESSSSVVDLKVVLPVQVSGPPSLSVVQADASAMQQSHFDDGFEQQKDEEHQQKEAMKSTPDSWNGNPGDFSGVKQKRGRLSPPDFHEQEQSMGLSPILTATESAHPAIVKLLSDQVPRVDVPERSHESGGNNLRVKLKIQASELHDQVIDLNPTMFFCGVCQQEVGEDGNCHHCNNEREEFSASTNTTRKRVRGGQGLPEASIQDQVDKFLKTKQLFVDAGESNTWIELGYTEKQATSPDSLAFWEEVLQKRRGLGLRSSGGAKLLAHWFLHREIIAYLVGHPDGDSSMFDFWQPLTQQYPCINSKRAVVLWRDFLNRVIICEQIARDLPEDRLVREFEIHQLNVAVSYKDGIPTVSKLAPAKKASSAPVLGASASLPKRRPALFLEVPSSILIAPASRKLADWENPLCVDNDDERQRPSNWRKTPATNPEEECWTDDHCCFTDSIFVMRGLERWEQYAFTMGDCFHKLELFDVPQSHPAYPGRGVKAFERIVAREVIGSYAGVLKPDMFIEHQSPFGFSVSKERKLSVDGRVYGNITRYINSCKGTGREANVYPVNYSLPLNDASDAGAIPCIYFVAATDIEIGDELLFDYGEDYVFLETPELRTLRQELSTTREELAKEKREKDRLKLLLAKYGATAASNTNHGWQQVSKKG